MKILLLTDAYPPEIRSASHLMQELAQDLHGRGHEVSVATCYPQYNLTKEAAGKSFPEVADEGGVRVIRIRTLPHHKVHFILRGISQVTLPWFFNRKIRKHVRGGLDAVIVYSPPLTLAQSAAWVKRRYGARFVLNVQDIFPQNAVDLGALKAGPALSYFEAVESSAYRAADAIAVHSNGNRDFLIGRKGVPLDRITDVPNWIDTGDYLGRARTGRFRKAWGIDGKVVFIFPGILGPSQNLDAILRAAAQLKDLRDLVLLFVGDGTERPRLEKLKEELGLDNVMFKPLVSKEDYPDLVKDSDVGMVSLSCKNTTPVVPSKLLSYMAASIPVVAFLNKESDGHEIIREGKCGLTCISDDDSRIAQAIRRMHGDRGRYGEYGERGLAYVSAHFSKKACIDRLEALAAGRALQAEPAHERFMTTTRS